MVAVLASLHCGAFTRRDVHALGGDDGLIERRLRQGRWMKVGPGVYILPSHPPTWQQRLWVARLTADFFSVVSHEAAAAFHGWPGFPEGALSFLVPHGSH